MKRRKLNVFSLSFLDIITCGLGAVILLFVLVNAKSAARRDAAAADLRADVDRVQSQMIEETKSLARLRNTLAQMRIELARTEGLAQRAIEILEQKKTQLADRSRDTLATRENVNRLKADLKSLEEDVKRLRAGAEAQEELGTRLRPFPGQGDRQYLTDLKMGGGRIFILVDASASMLDDTVVGAIRRRNLPESEKLRSPKWRQVVDTIDWVTAQLPAASKYQVYAFNETAKPLIPDTGGGWLDAGNIDQLNQTVAWMRKRVPEKGTSLANAFNAIKEMNPPPDNIFLLTDSLPTMGAQKPWSNRVSGKKRLRLFEEAVERFPAGVPINIILYPMEGDPFAASAYWKLAKDTRGSFFCPSRDWP
jgi:hypothetical protein